RLTKRDTHRPAGGRGPWTAARAAWTHSWRAAGTARHSGYAAGLLSQHLHLGLHHLSLGDFLNQLVQHFFEVFSLKYLGFELPLVSPGLHHCLNVRLGMGSA